MAKIIKGNPTLVLQGGQVNNLNSYDKDLIV